MSGGSYDLEEIRQRADIVEIISPHVALRKSGRRLTGLCPFHDERTGSFTVDPENGLWHCFGCKAGGDLFRFVEMIENVSFSEAVEMLARRLGIAPKHRGDVVRQRERDRLLDLHQAACEFFGRQLRSPAGKKTRVYLTERGISQEVAQTFSLGYAPGGWDGLLNAMAQKGYPGQALAQAGLAVAREGGFYDRFRDRLIFPIWDATGRVVAFGGRALDDDQQPKYLNSPETSLFAKGRTLYAFDRARRAMGEAERAIVVEGYLDAIACHEAGLTETVATMGTALTANHVEMLRRRVSRLVLAFDSDSAGLAAALRGRDLFQQAGLTVRVVTLPGGLDPDAVIREQGKETFAELVAAAVPMVEWEMVRVLTAAGGAGEQARAESMRDAVRVLARLPAGVEREYYTRWLAQHLGGDSPSHAASMEVAIRDELGRTAARSSEAQHRSETPGAEPEARGEQSRETTTVSLAEAGLLAALITHGEAAVRHAAEIEPGDFSRTEHGSVFAAIGSLMDRGLDVTPETVLAEVDPEARGALAELLLQRVPEERVEALVESAVRRLAEGRLRRREASLRRQFEQTTSEDDRERILRELTACRQQRSHLAGHRLIGQE